MVDCLALWLLLAVAVQARLKVLDVPLQSGGTGTICGDKACAFCCLEGFECATYLPDCGYISQDNHTEHVIFYVCMAFYGVGLLLWLYSAIGKMRRAKLQGGNSLSP